MNFCCICITYGRVMWLEEAITAYKLQTLKALVGHTSMLVVLNTCPDQVLVGPEDDIAWHNLTQRPLSLGEARNMAIGSHGAPEDVIVIWDDDDIALPNHLQTIAEAFTDDVEWIWLDTQFHMEGNQIKSIVAGSCPLFAFRKRAWSAAGGYPNLTVGEDRRLIASITTTLPGRKVTPKSPTYLYRWGQGTYHASGQGDDTPGRERAHIRIEMDLNDRIRSGKEPVGTVTIVPNWKQDYVAIARQFMGQVEEDSPDNADVCLVELGRFGDIVNILPICAWIHEHYRTPYVMVSRQFASLLDGVSYVKPFVVDIPHSKLNQALDLATKLFRFVLNCQIWGEKWVQERLMPAYNMDSWRQAGFIHMWSDPEMVPVFDRRDSEREKTLVERVISADPERMLILVETNSTSSPFARGKELISHLQGHWGEVADIVDLGKMTFPRIYDVLALMDRASILITVDTSMLHIAAASDVPVIAFVNSVEWLATAERCNCVLRLPYDQFDLSLVEQAISSFSRGSVTNPEKPRTLLVPADNQTIYHVCERHDAAVIDPRKEPAWDSWKSLYSSGVVPMHLWEIKYPRNAATVLGDARPLPFLKDVLAQALADHHAATDIVLWTNDDNWLHPDLPARLKYHVSIWGACTASRCEFKRTIPRGLSPTGYANIGQSHIGRDLFACSVLWLEEHWEEIPDFVLGASEFDLCLAAMVRKQFGIMTTRGNIEHVIHPAELPRGYVCHQYHAPKWQESKNEASAPSQLHNRRLFKEWAAKYLPDLKLTPEGRL